MTPRRGPAAARENETPQRLQILGMIGHHQEVLELSKALLVQTGTLPPQASAAETVRPHNVREIVCDIAFQAACRLMDWSLAISFNERMIANKRARGASAHDLTIASFNGYLPLLRSGRLGEAERLLLSCQQAFEEAGDFHNVGRSLGARAELASRRGRLDEAVTMTQTAIRYLYQQFDQDKIAVGHHNLAGYLHQRVGIAPRRIEHRLDPLRVRPRLVPESAVLDALDACLAKRALEETALELVLWLEDNGYPALIERCTAPTAARFGYGDRPGLSAA